MSIERSEELHFMNASTFEAGKFSCAVDCFLELWLRKVSVSFEGFSQSYIIRLLSSLRNHYITKREECRQCPLSSLSGLIHHASLQLHYIREDIWSYLRRQCPSFVRMDCS